MPAPPPAPSSAPRRNLELKVRVSAQTLEHLRALAASVADGPSDLQHQDDRYFQVPEGRLKLRAITDDTGVSRGELIAYRRPDAGGSRWSAYRITRLDAGQAEDLAATLELVLRPLVRVRKRRDILLHGATRIHLDEVEGLGAFVELETVVTNQTATSAEQEHRRVIVALGLDAWPTEARSYSDLLEHMDDDAPRPAPDRGQQR